VRECAKLQGGSTICLRSTSIINDMRAVVLLHFSMSLLVALHWVRLSIRFLRRPSQSIDDRMRSQSSPLSRPARTRRCELQYMHGRSRSRSTCSLMLNSSILVTGTDSAAGADATSATTAGGDQCNYACMHAWSPAERPCVRVHACVCACVGETNCARAITIGAVKRRLHCCDRRRWEGRAGRAMHALSHFGLATMRA
jgi:hypothetical protein